MSVKPQALTAIIMMNVIVMFVVHGTARLVTVGILIVLVSLLGHVVAKRKKEQP